MEISTEQGYNLTSVKENYVKFLAGGAIALAIAMVVAFILANLGNLSAPKLVSVSPKDGSTGVTPFTDVSMTFDRGIAVDNSTKFKISPNVDGKVTIADKVLTFVPTAYFDIGKKFTVTLTDPTGNWGAKGSTVSFSFTVKDQASLSQDEKDKLQALSSVGLGLEAKKGQQEDPAIQRAYAINAFIDTLPYQGPSGKYSISYTGASATFVIYIMLSPYDGNKQAALDYMKSKGVDPSWVTVQYTSVRGVYPGH